MTEGGQVTVTSERPVSNWTLSEMPSDHSRHGGSGMLRIRRGQF